MPDIDPETDEVVDAVSRTCQLRTEEAKGLREIIRKMVDKGNIEADQRWRAGFFIGCISGMVGFGVVIWLLVWVVQLL